MADFDPCECVFSHESAMRRLLSLLRNSQAYCTDTECATDMPGPSGADGLFGGGHGMFYMMTLWMVVALALFFLRPRSLRNRPDTKPGPSSQDPSGSDDQPGPSNRPPPAPPVA